MASVTKNASATLGPGKVPGDLAPDDTHILTPWPAGTTQIEFTVPSIFGSKEEAVNIAVNPPGDDFTVGAEGTERVYPGESVLVDVTGASTPLKVVLKGSGRPTAYQARKR